MTLGAVLSAGALSLAADCPNSAPRVVYNRAYSAPVARYSYRSGYSGQTVASGTTMAPAMSSSGNAAHSVAYGPERNLDYARARQHIRGW